MAPKMHRSCFQFTIQKNNFEKCVFSKKNIYLIISEFHNWTKFFLHRQIFLIIFSWIHSSGKISV